MSWEDVLKVQLQNQQQLDMNTRRKIKDYYNNQLRGDMQRAVNAMQAQGKNPKFSVVVNPKQLQTGFKTGRLGGQTYVIGSQAYSAMGQPRPDLVYAELGPLFSQGGFDVNDRMRGGLIISTPKSSRQQVNTQGMGRRAFGALRQKLPGGPTSATVSPRTPPPPTNPNEIQFT